MIKSIIFDCFGVLTEDGWLAFMAQYATDENAEALRYANHQMDKGLISYDELLETVCSTTSAPRDVAHKLITTTHHPNEPLFALIHQLKERGYILGVISNVGAPLSEYLPKEYLTIFDAAALSYQVGAIKPDPRIYQAYLEKVNLVPTECIFIDDREPNVVGAQDVGMGGIVYTTVNNLVTQLANFGVSVDF
jgi:putative hydrolase of the HAD superfamily